MGNKRGNRNRNPAKRKGLPNNPGQHFIHHRKLLNEMVQWAQVGPDDLVLDLGAGKGSLTSVLSQHAGAVVAVEYDQRLVEQLRETFSRHANVKIVYQDILNVRWPKEPFLVVSNIPFAITTPLMKKLLNNPASGFQRGVILMEKGAAKRFTAKAVKDAYVMAWRMWFDLRYVKTVSRIYFSPMPSVDSALVAVQRKTKPLVPHGQASIFRRLVERGLADPHLSFEFAFRGMFTPPQLAKLKRNLGVPGDLPVGLLTEKHWGMIHDTMVKVVPEFRWP